jgi:hypothetical protein
LVPDRLTLACVVHLARLLYPKLSIDSVKRLVPNADEQAVIARMQALRQDSATYRAIGTAVSKGPKVVQRILERVDGAQSARIHRS